MRPTLPVLALLLATGCPTGSGTVDGDDTAADDTADDTTTDDTAVDDTQTDTDTGNSQTDTDVTDCTTIDAIVTDIDETLTTSDYEWIQQLLNNDHDPAMRPDANTLMQDYADKGYAIVYVTARGTDIPVGDGGSTTQLTEDWLTAHDFPPGQVFLASGIGALGNSAVDYKAGVIEGLQAQGYVFDLAYGNADTDIGAYRAAGIPDADMFLVGALAGQMGVTGISDDDAYTAHLPYVASVPDAECPAP